MTLKPRIRPHYDVEWWVISVSTIKKVAATALALLLGLTLYFSVRMYLDHRAETARAASEIDSAANESPEKGGYFIEIEGSVRVKKKGSEEWVKADKNLNLNTGDLVMTGTNSSAHILLFDGTEYTVKSESMTMIQSSLEDPRTKVRNVAVQVKSGAIDMSTSKKNRSDSRTELSSPSGTASLGELTQAGVSVNAESAETSIQIYRGEGDIRSGDQSVHVASGEGVTVSPTRGIGNKVTLLPPPDLIEPANLKQFAYAEPAKELVGFSWRQVEGARYFHLLISPTPLFSQPLVNTRLGSRDLSVRVSGMIDGSYFWKVYGIDANGIEGRPSATRRFRIISDSRRLQNFDVTPPPLSVDPPSLSGNIALVRGRTEPGTLLTINGEQVDVESDGTFFHPTILEHSGKNELIVTAQDASGNETRRPITVYAEFY